MQKKYEILYGSYDYIVQFGLKNFSLNALLKYLQISKGTFYHYFRSKDEMLLEVFEYLTLTYIQENQKKLKKANNLKEKLEVVFDTYLIDNAENRDFLVFYKEFILSKTYSDTLKVHAQQFQLYFKNIIESILTSEIEKGAIKPNAINFVTSLMTIADGILIYSFSIDEFNLQDELTKFINSFVELVEIKNKGKNK